MNFLYLIDDGGVLGPARAIYSIRVQTTMGGFVRRNRDNRQAIYRHEFICRFGSSSGHSRKFGIFAEEALKRGGEASAKFRRRHDIIVDLQCLMNAVGKLPTGQQTAR